MTARVISHVSDTARWVAAHRAHETARPDALFEDRFAERLGGERGRAIAAVAPPQTRNGWPVVVRTKLIDDLIMACVADGCDCVVNLAAGLDTRPYRLPLPATLRFIEADLPALLEEKAQLLADDKPVCDLSRVAVDLTDPCARRAFIDRVLRGTHKALVISEGLLCYLDAAHVASLSADLLARPDVHWWIFDMFSPAVRGLMEKRMGAHLVDAPMQFAPANGVTFFEALGWTAADTASIFHHAARLRRLPLWLRPFGYLREPNPRHPGNDRWSAVIRLQR